MGAADLPRSVSSVSNRGERREPHSGTLRWSRIDMAEYERELRRRMRRRRLRKCGRMVRWMILLAAVAAAVTIARAWGAAVV